MRSKKLTIIFFSVMMLAATPRVMSHFKSYSDALHQRVEAEWLDFLLGFSASTEIQTNEPIVQTAQPSLCEKSKDYDVMPAVVVPVSRTKARAHWTMSKTQTFDFKFENALAQTRNPLRLSPPQSFPSVPDAMSPGVHTPPPPADLVAGKSDDFKKVQYLWRLTQSTQRGKSRTVRALARDFKALVSSKARTAEVIPIEVENIVDQWTVEDRNNTDQGSESNSATMDEAMH